MGEYNGRKLAKDHKNPSYDSDEDGVVEASQLPAVDGLDPGDLGSGEFLKFDGSGLVGATVSVNLSVQTPQDVSGSRSSGTQYTNTTGSPLIVTVVGRGDPVANVRADIDGSKVSNNNAETQYTNFASAQVIVPDGSTYTVSYNSLEKWTEQVMSV